MGVMRALAAAILGAVALLGGAGGVQALSVDCSFSSDPSLTPAPSTKKGGIGGGTTVAFSIDTASQVACFDGNDTNSIGPSFALFGQTGWVLADKNDDRRSGDGKLLFSFEPRNGARLGRFAVSNLMAVRDIAVTLKAGPGFAAFRLDGGNGAALDSAWRAGKELSHSSIYYRPRPATTLPPVPLPAGLLLLGSALAGVVALRRSRAKA